MSSGTAFGRHGISMSSAVIGKSPRQVRRVRNVLQTRSSRSPRFLPTRSSRSSRFLLIMSATRQEDIVTRPTGTSPTRDLVRALIGPRATSGHRRRDHKTETTNCGDNRRQAQQASRRSRRARQGTATKTSVRGSATRPTRPPSGSGRSRRSISSPRRRDSARAPSGDVTLP